MLSKKKTIAGIDASRKLKKKKNDKRHAQWHICERIILL